MGKANKKRPHRVNPLVESIEFATIDVNVEESTDAVQDSVIQSIMDQLQSPKSEDRDCGANSLATLPQTKNDVLAVLKTGAARACAPLLLDKSAAIRHSAAGALRNLSTVGGEEACELMVSQDVMTPLFVFLKKFPTTWSPSTKKPPQASIDYIEKIDSSEQQFTEAVTLLWNLCENSPKAVEISNSEGIVDILKVFLSPEKYGRNVVVTTENCLYTLTENNPSAIEKLKTEDVAILNLMSLDGASDGASNPSKMLMRVIAAGIGYNMCSGDVTSLPPNIQHLIGESVAASLSPGLSEALVSISEVIRQHQVKGEEATADIQLEEKQLEDQLQQFEDLVSSQSSSLMLLANLCCSGEFEDWEDVSSSDESEVNNEDDEMPEVVQEEKSNLPDGVLEALRGQARSRPHVFQLVLAKTLPVEGIAVGPGKYLRKWKGLIAKLKVLRNDAFLCLSNLVPVLSVGEMGGATAVFDAWCNLNRMIFQSEETAANMNLAEAAVNGIRSLTEKIREASPQCFEQLTPDDATTLCSAIFQCSEPSVRASLVRILSCIGVSLAGKPVATPSEKACSMIKIIGSCLIQVITTDSELWIVAEALDAIYDLFGEDHIDHIVAEIGLIQTLKTVAAPLKQKVNKEKKTLGEHLAIVTTAKLNLNRFIKYKLKTK